MNNQILKELILNINKRTGIRNYILEKDYYVCQVLKSLSSQQKELQAYFKGGTAIYKILNNMSRFSEDIDLTVRIDSNASNNSNKTRLKKSALNYEIDGLNLIKEKTIDKKGSITSFYQYNSLFDINELFKSGYIQIESTSFTVSEPVSTYTIEPLIFKYATENEKNVLKNKFNIREFDIEIIKLERIFIDKIFAVEFYYQRNMYKDVVKHLYDITIMFKNEDIQNVLKNITELKRLINYKREEEKMRIGGIEQSLKISDFTYLNTSFNNELIKAFDNMQKIYVIGEENKITFNDVKKTINTLLTIFKDI